MSATSRINKVFGVGLSRTGTTSLNAALELLGIKSIHFPEDKRTCDQLLAGDYNLDILNNYQAITDIVVAPFYPQFDVTFPGSKFILTVRDRDDWIRSARYLFDGWRRAIESHEVVRADGVVGNRLTISLSNYIDFCTYGLANFNEHRFLYVYDQHIRNVKEYFAGRDDLLVLDICSGQGWESLCPFLGLPIPDCKFPWRNKASENGLMRRSIRLM